MAHITIADSLFFTPIMLSYFFLSSTYDVHLVIHPVYILSISCIHPVYIRRISCLYPVYILSISCLYPVYIRHPIRSSSAVEFYLRSDLTADYRTSPVPAISTFIYLFYYFIIMMFERFMKCIVSFLYCVSLTIQYLCPASSVHPAPYPFYIFGRILPSVRSYRRL